MTIKLYILRDQIAEMAGPIFEAKNDNVARRNIKNMFMQKKEANPNDFALFKIGEKHTETGEITATEFTELDISTEDLIK